MEEIRVNEYVRDKDGCIIKVNEIQDYSEDNDIWYEEGRLKGTWKSMVVKHSPNIIDLIEEGDYVNGLYVYGITDYGLEVYMYGDAKEILREDEIKSVVTKEMFSQVKYEV